MTEERKGFYFELLELLEQDPEKRFYADDGKDLLRNKVYECAMKMDKDLIKLLLSNDRMKEKFFTDIDGTLVFDKTAFGWAINNKAFLQDSYTRFKNNIRLIDSREQFISSKNDVVLSFPYKDCVLEGGQTKEDQKRGEIFYNELLAPDDVDRLLAPKVFTNMKRYTKDGEEVITSFNDNDNLLIKGNNLLALSSILKRYEGKVKCIYIDPPFNTEKDSFRYNDNFNHSTWLTFMSNRLKLSKKLLASNGLIFVHLDFNESHYCKILMDEIFGQENFKNNIVWCYTGPAGATDFLPRKHDDILFYGKTNESKINMPYIAHKSGVHNTGQVFNSVERKDNFKEEVEARGKKLEDWWIDIYSTDRYRSELIGFVGQKPEKLLQRIIEMCTNEGEIVLDFHLGSGTTAAVAQKMNRQWIGIEQLDYGEIDSVIRLQKVLRGDETGISKSVNWHGGGSFVYCELKELNHKYIDEIQAADDNKLNDLYKEITESEFISYKADINKLKESEQDFKELSTEDKRSFLIQVLDKNLLYVNYCDMEDEDLAVTEEEKAFARSFYGEGV